MNLKKMKLRLMTNKKQTFLLSSRLKNGKFVTQMQGISGGIKVLIMIIKNKNLIASQIAKITHQASLRHTNVKMIMIFQTLGERLVNGMTETLTYVGILIQKETFVWKHMASLNAMVTLKPKLLAALANTRKILFNSAAHTKFGALLTLHVSCTQEQQ